MLSATGDRRKNMKAIYEGHTNVDKNAMFSVQHKYAKQMIEVKDGVNTDFYDIGNEYEICESLLKKVA